MINSIVFYWKVELWILLYQNVTLKHRSSQLVSQNMYFGGIMPSFIKETKKLTSAIPEVQE